MIGVGTCDEPVLLAGISHLVEHLAVRGALPVVTWHNAVTSDWATSFEVTSATTQDALDVLVRVTESIAALVDASDADVERERRVLASEDRLRYHEQVPSIHTVRFGPTGPGRSGAGAAPTHSLTAMEVRDWVRRWYVAENAIVTVTGGTAPATRLSVALPAGAPPGPLPLWTGRTEGGFLQTIGSGGVAASVIVPQGTAQLLEAVIEHEVFDDVRIGAALSYAVDAHTVDIDLETSAVAVVVDPAQDDVAATVELVVSALRRIAERGPSATTLARVGAARVLNTLDATVRADIQLSFAALQRLRGRRDPGILPPEVTDEEVADLRAALRGAMPDLVVCIDEDLDVDHAAVAERVGLTLRERTIGTPLHEAGPLGRPTGSAHRDAMVPTWATAWAQLHGPVLTMRLREGGDRAIDLSAVAVVGLRGDHGITIVDGAGEQFQVRAEDWWRGARLVAEVRAATPPHLVREFSA